MLIIFHQTLATYCASLSYCLRDSESGSVITGSANLFGTRHFLDRLLIHCKYGPRAHTSVTIKAKCKSMHSGKNILQNLRQNRENSVKD